MENFGLALGFIGICLMGWSIKRIKDGRFKEGFREAGTDFGLMALGIGLCVLGNTFLWVL